MSFQIESRETLHKNPVRILILTLLLLASFLFVRAFDSTRWSEWPSGDAQTLMAVDHFVNEGFLPLKFLWVPQPYSPIGKYLDEKEVSHHGHGSAGVSLGAHRIYTHWPSWYSVPYGVMGKMGIVTKAYYQWLAIIISLTAIFIFYKFCALHMSQASALVSSLSYIGMAGWLGFADSLATMPHDDLCRALFMYLWSCYRIQEDRKYFLYSLLTIFFALLTSLDSVLFIPAFALFYDLIFCKRAFIKQYLIIGIPIFLAFGIQFLQNGLYLGFNEAWLDWKDYFVNNGAQSGFLNRWPTVEGLLHRAYEIGHGWMYLIISFAAFSGFKKYPSASKLMLILFICGSAFPFVLMGKAAMSYEVRQFYPFIAVTFGMLWFGLYYWFTKLSQTFFKSNKLNQGLGLLLALFVISITLYSYHSKHHFRQLWSLESNRTIKEMEFIKTLKQRVPGERVIFHLDKVLPVQPWMEDYPQVSPLIEYYLDSICLSFRTTDLLVRDFKYFWEKETNQFKPVIIFNPTMRSTSSIESAFATAGIGADFKSVFESDNIVALEISHIKAN